ncbi:unnamed protein product [Spirodela intermedia]|uniref:Uncharacterized protein n=1 Tax=Spirodela intermedia TaxID=51605 RepID=A0A7I8JCE3_SPIIN|nr:unnamed protein product [Spirodela intermedia]CAA6667847.1 unnamed protein product [Spirodela intermedia]
MCHAVKRLFCGWGSTPPSMSSTRTPGEGDGKGPNAAPRRRRRCPRRLHRRQARRCHGRVMASHINGTLVPLLKEAGALWL